MAYRDTEQQYDHKSPNYTLKCGPPFLVTSEDNPKWASASEPHTSVFNVEISLYGTYIFWSVHHGQCSHLSWSLISYRTLLLPPHIFPIFLHHSVSCRPSDIEHVCPTVRPCLGNTDRGGGKEQMLRLGMKEPLYCTAYTLLPHSLSPHNVLLKTKYVILQSAEWFSNQQCVVLTKSQETEQQ